MATVDNSLSNLAWPQGKPYESYMRRNVILLHVANFIWFGRMGVVGCEELYAHSIGAKLCSTSLHCDRPKREPINCQQRARASTK
jgi:hypothetical protein